MLSVESGPEWTENLRLAAEGRLDAPYLIFWEGSIMDETVSGEYGYWMGLGEDRTDGRQITSLEWLDRLAPGAAAVLSIGTCASAGGRQSPPRPATPPKAPWEYDPPSARDYAVPRLGLPVINIPGCSPVGDNITETAAAALLFLNGLAPLPEFDELGRPAWAVHRDGPPALPPGRLLRGGRVRALLGDC